MIPVGSAIPEGVGVGMDKGKRFVVDARKRSRNCQKQMSNMPSVFDFGFQTSHYSIPNDSLNGFGDYDQPNGGQNVSTNRNVYPNDLLMKRK